MKQEFFKVLLLILFFIAYSFLFAMTQNMISFDKQTDRIPNIYIGNPDSPTESNQFPINFYYKNSLSQTIYKSEEINATGDICGLIYYARLDGSVTPGKRIKIWLANTEVSSFSSGDSWLPSNIFTLVFDDIVDFSQVGVQEKRFDLNVPFVYSGQNLAVMIQRPMDSNFYTSQNKWLNTNTPQYYNRTIYRASDTINLEPDNAGSGTISTYIPNVSILFIATGTGSIQGFVTSNGVPVNNALISVDNNNISAFSDSTGFYQLNNLPTDSLDITVSCENYYETYIQNIVAVQNDTISLNIEMQAIPNSQVSGRVLSIYNDTPVSDATVVILGEERYETLTASDGSFQFPSIPLSSDYSIHIAKPGFITHSISPLNIDTSNYIIPDITLIYTTFSFLNESFESVIFPPIGWTIVDMDNDTHNWELNSIPSNAFDGGRCAASESNSLHIQSPDNYLITPKMDIEMGWSHVLFYAIASSSSSQFAEEYTLLISTTDNQISSFVPIFTETLNSSEYSERYFNLENYWGQSIYIAFRHHSLNPMDYLLLDKVFIYKDVSNDIVINHNSTRLYNNYPNPFNPETRISFNLNSSQKVSLNIYNIKGEIVKTLLDQYMNMGNHEIVWNGKDADNKPMPSGIYFYQLKTSSFMSTKKMLLLK